MTALPHMEEIVREPCPRCGEPAAVAGRICPHCGGPLLVDLSAGPVADARSRYRVARELISLGPPFVSLGAVRHALEAGTIVAAGITRAAAAAALHVLDRHDIRGRLAAPGVPPLAIEPEPPRVFRPARERLLFILPLVATVGILWLLSRSPAAPRPGVSRASADPTAAPPPAQAQKPRPLSPRELAARGIHSTASVFSGASSGSGFFVAPDLLVTNDHVLGSGGGGIQIALRDGRRLAGVAEARDDWLDLALVRVPGGNVPPLLLGDATSVAPGDACLLIGNPIGMDFTVTEAIISHNRRSVFGIAYLQFDANVNPGNSGGPLLASDGRVIGIVSMAVVGAKGLGLALAVNYLFDTQAFRVPLPVPAPDFPAWRSLLREVREQDERDAAEARAAFDKPALAGAAIDQAGEIVIAVAVRGMPSGAMPLQFDLFRNEQLLCSATAIVETWDPFGSARPRPIEDSRRTRWLRQVGLGHQLYVGTAPLRIEGCPEVTSLLGAHLLLRSGDPAADRTVVRAMRMLP